MDESQYSLMIELLSRIRNNTIEGCRAELALQQKRLETRPDPWIALRSTLQETKETDDKSPVPKEGVGSFLFKTATTRLMDNMAATSQKKDEVALRQVIENRLNECRMACMIFSLNAGNAGMPWTGVDFLPPQETKSLAVRIGLFTIFAEDMETQLPEIDWKLPVPAMLPFDTGRAVFVNGPGDLRTPAINALHSVALRLILAVSPELIRVSVLDPLGFSLGNSPWSQWPGVVCTDMQKIEDRVSEIFAGMERIADQNLQGHANLQSFNQWAKANGEPTLPYHILVIHDCPKGLSPNVLQKLHGIAQNGGRCGVFPLIHWGENIDEYNQSKLSALAAGGVIIGPDDADQFKWQEEAFADCRLELDTLPTPDDMNRIIQPVIKAWQVHADRTLDFDAALKNAGQGGGWTESSAMGIHAPLGVAETGKVVQFEVGEGKGTHGLIIGGTGSGKSSLMHVLITALAGTYSPEELQLYLIDLKGGVEFKRYATSRLPHVAVVAIDCDREFAVSSLEFLCSEMRRRMDLYRAHEADITSIPQYREIGGQLPRILLVMDEFQRLLAEGDDIADRAKGALDSLLKEGRAFGIHVFLGTQSLKGISMRGGSLEQIFVRVVLQCSAEDSKDALATDNTAGRNLPKYHGIYNDQQGRKDANTQFKAAYLSPEQNGIRLAAISARRAEAKWNATVFEGNAKPLVSSCVAYNDVIVRQSFLERGAASRIWLGEPVSIHPSVEVVLDAQRGRSVLAIMQNPDEGIGILLNSLLTLLAQHKPGSGKFSIIDLVRTAHQTQGWPQKIQAMFDHQIAVVDPQNLGSFLATLVEDLNNRLNSPALCVPHFVFVMGLQYARELRPKETYGEPDPGTPAGALLYLLKEGPEHGIHILTWCDMWSNVDRCGGRRLLDEFGVRVTGKMEQSDSSIVLGSPIAARLRSVNRATLLDDASPGIVQVFRPYDLPTLSLFELLSEKLKERRK